MLEHTERANVRNLDLVASIRQSLARFDTDPDKKARSSQHQHKCKACYYLRSDQFAFQAFTNRPCECCEAQVQYSSTATDCLCIDCAEKLQLCKCCGADMD